jgi:hypothetical protein
MFIYTNRTICLVHPSFHHLLSSLIAINFIHVSSTGSLPSTLPFAHDNELEKDLVQALHYMDDADLRHWHVLNTIYRRLSRQGVSTSHTEIEQN